MNSDEERALFEKWSWSYDYIARQWMSPKGDAAVRTDDLVQWTTSPEMENALRDFIMMNGRPQ